MEKKARLNLIGQLLLFAATIVWGTSFFILKETIATYPPMYVIGFRFFLSAIILFLIFIKRIIKLTKGALVRGIAVGLCIAAAYLTQTYGLAKTSPGTNAFLTSLYCVICPFLFWLFYRVKPKLYNIVSMVLCVIGLALVAFSGGEESENEFIGCILTIISAIFFALQIVFNDRFQKNNDDTFQLLFVQLLTVGIILLAISFIFELPIHGIDSYLFKREHLFNVIYLTLACTVFAQLAQILGQKYTQANQAAIILSLEAVFGALFSVIFGAEQLSLILFSGFVVIFLSVLITELRVDFRKLLSGKLKNKGDINEVKK